jgi:hypothetical protein
MIRATACNEIEDRLARRNLSLIDRATLCDASVCREDACNDLNICNARMVTFRVEHQLLKGRGAGPEIGGSQSAERPAGEAESF